MYKKILRGILVSIMLISCTSNQENIEVKFPQINMLNGQSIKNINSYDPRDLLVYDSLLIVLNRQGDYFIQYYNINTFELIGEYGKKGRGPGEFLYPLMTGQPIIQDQENVYLVLFDLHRRNIYHIDILESLINNNYICSSEKLDNSLSSTGDILFSNDSLICTIPDQEEPSRFVLYDKKTDSKKRIQFSLDSKENIHFNNLYFVYATQGKAVIENDKVFLAMPACKGQVDYFDYNGDFLKSIIFDRNQYINKASSANSIHTIDGFKIYFTKIRVIDNRIFILFNINQFPDGKSISKSKIFVLTSEGNPVVEYILDTEILLFDIDTLNNRFIGYNSKESYPFVKFDY